MRVLVVICLIVLLASPVLAIQTPTNSTLNNSQYATKRNFAVNISVSSSHKPTYQGWYAIKPNYTINYTKTPRVLQGITPQIKKPSDLSKDVVRNQNNVTLDPRTCANNLALCYQVIDHQQNKTVTPGKNYSALSTFVLPEQRIRTYVCIANNNTACVQSATNCFCPSEKVPPPPQVLGKTGRCSSSTHVCLTDSGTFQLCVGNLSSCQKQYVACGCGTAAACVSKRNTCINSRNQLVYCKGPISDCLEQYDDCFCGPDMLTFQKGCTTSAHRCIRGKELAICEGSLASCALKFDKCEC